MDWANNLFLALLLTDITGTIFFLAGQILRLRTEQDAGFQRFLEQVALWAYLLPVVYVVKYLGRQFRMVGMETKINLFYNTPMTRKINALCGCIWFGLFFALLTYRLVRHFRWRWTCRGNIPEEEEMVFRVLEEVRADLGIRGRVSVCRNDSVTIPCITYNHGYTVVLPLWCYTEHELRVIFYHELCHFLDGDLFLKAIGGIVTLLHVFNPAAHILFWQIKADCEKYCDRVACKKGKEIFTDAQYFQVILDQLKVGTKQRYQLFALADKLSNCERRVRYMEQFHARGGLRKGTAVMLAVCFLLGSSTTSMAAGSGVGAVYEKVARKTSVKNEYEQCSVSDADQEAVEVLSRKFDLNPEDVVMMDDEGIELCGVFYNITWKIPAGKTFMSSGFRQDEGEYVTLTVDGTPVDIDYEMGIKDPEDIMWYVEGSDSTSQKFDIEISGRHYFYVTNLSETEELRADVSLIRHMFNSPEE